LTKVEFWDEPGSARLSRRPIGVAPPRAAEKRILPHKR
jgi:hypothetical protein